MTRVRRGRGIAAVLATIAGAVLATTAQNNAHAATHPDPTGADAGRAARTTLHLHITGCDTCTVELQHAVTGAAHVWSSSPKKIGADHRAAFRTLTAHTHGMSFVLRAPWEGDTGAVPNIVTRYAGHAVDSSVSQRDARHGSLAEGCWAGTTVDDVRLGFHVARVPGTTLGGQATRIPLAYATHTMSSWKPLVKTFKGTIGNQDAFYCTKPPTTKLTFSAADCEGCEIGVMNGAMRVENTWAVDPKKVSGGQVTFRVPRPETRGISATVLGPWEGTTGYTTLVAFRYAHHRAGDAVGFDDARSRHHASACWGGTTEKTLTVPLTIQKVTVRGTTGPTDGTIAYADVTQPWLEPMMRAGQGVLGSQEVIACRK
jgi:hypothetical protein